MAMAAEVQLDDYSKRYDPALSYEERSKIRKEERERKLQDRKAKTPPAGSSSRHQGPSTSQDVTSKQRHSSSSSSSSSCSSSTSSSAKSSSRIQNGGYHHRSAPTSKGKANKGGKSMTGKVSSPSPVFSEKSNESSECDVGKVTKPQSNNGPKSPPLLSPTERNGHTSAVVDTIPQESNFFLSPPTSSRNDPAERRKTPILSRVQIEAIASLTPDPAVGNDAGVLSQSRNTPVLSRAQIEVIASITPDPAGTTDVGILSQRRYTPVLSPWQLQAISNDGDGCISDETNDESRSTETRQQLILSPDVSESRVAAQNLNGNHEGFNQNLVRSPEFQSVMNCLDGEPSKDGREGALSSLSRQSTLSSSSGFTVDGLDQLLSPTRPKSTDTPSSQFFSYSLQFVDTEEAQTSPSALTEEPPIIRGPMQRTAVVYRDYEDSSSSLVTMIPSSGFFDPSQSQADVLDKNDVIVPDEVIDGESLWAKKTGGEKKKKKEKGKELKKGSRRDKSPLLPMKGDVSERIIEEEEDSHAEVKSSNIEHEEEEKASHKKEEKGRRLFGSKRKSASGSDISQLTPVSRLHDSAEQKPRGLERSASSSSAKKSLSPFRKAKKTSQSFREDMREKSVSPDRDGLNKLSSPYLGTPSPPRSLGSREITPESGGSDTSSGHGQGKKRKTSIAQKIMSLVGGTSKENKENAAKPPIEPNPVTLMTYKKLDVDLPSPPGETASDITTSGSNLDIALSFSGSFEESGRSSGSLSAKKEGNLPSRPQSAAALGSHARNPGIRRGPNKQSNDLELPEVKSGWNLSPRSSTKSNPHSPRLGAQKRSLDLRGGVTNKHTSSPVAKRPSSASSSSSLSPQSSARGTSSMVKKSPSISPQLSARGTSSPGKCSPIISPRSSTRGTSSSRKDSPSISPQSATKKASSPAKLSPSGSPRSPMRGTSSPGKGSPGVSRRGTSSASGRVISPLATKKTSRSASPKSTPQSSNGVGSKRDSPRKASASSTAADATAGPTKSASSTSSATAAAPSPKSSPTVSRTKIVVTSQRNASPSNSRRKSGPLSTAPPKASPLTKRKITPSAEGKLTSSVSSLSTGNSSSPKSTSPSSSSRKPAPPRLTKVSLDSSSDVDSSKSKLSPGFTRFSNTRKPIKFNKSPEASNQPSPIMEHGAPEATKTRTMSESSIVSSSSSSQGSIPFERRRKIGISCTESPLASPVILKTFFGDDPSGGSNAAASSSVSLDIESLLASVEKKLNNIASTSSKQADGNNNDGMSSEDLGVSHVPSHSPEVISSPKFSPLLHKKSVDDQKGSKGGVTVVTVKVKDVGNSKQLASPSISAKSIAKNNNKKNSAVDSPASSKKNLGATPKSAKKSFTSARPPKGPLLKKASVPVEPSGAPMSKPPMGKPPVSSTGTTRPRMVLGGNASQGKRVMAKMESAPALRTVSEDSSNSSADVTKKHNESSSSRRNSVFNRSMKARSSSRIKPGSANVAGRRASVVATQHQHQQQQQQLQQQQQQQQHQNTQQPHQQEKQDSNFTRPSSGHVSNRKSMRRMSSVDNLKKARPGSSSTLGRDRRISLAPPSMASSTGGLGGGMYATMRRPKSGSNIKSAVGGAGSSGLTRSPATMSMRLPRKMSVVSQLGNTLRRGSKAGGPPPATVTDPSALSPSRSSTLKRVTSGGTLRKQSTAGETMAAFDHVSSQANMLVSSDHRRAVRPKARQKASTSHLKILNSRTDVSSDLNCQDDDDKLDPNTYSTYMSKKNLAPSAMAGLASKVDFSTVKLRKTNSLQQQMMTDQAGGTVDSSFGSPGVAAGIEYNTSHPVMLLQVKGRRNIQTRLVEPSGTSLNSGDVFILVTKDKLFHWVGKSANVIEKARGSDVVMRIVHKKELNCKVTAATVLKEEERAENLNSKRDEKFWELLGGKTGVKSSECAAGDEVYERAVNMVTTVYRLEGADKDSLQFVPIHENSNKMVTVDILHTKQIFLFDFYSEVYVWIGNQSPSAFRRKAMELGKQLYGAGCKTPALNLRSSPARSSGRYRPRNSLRSPRHSVVNMSGRRTSRVSKADMKPRPEWALFARVTEGSESILFREKFGDWPEAGRIIKMKGHVSSGEVLMRPVQIELHPADVDKMLKDPPPFEGLRLEGDNMYRGQGNFKVSKSTFSRNRVRTVEVKKWVVKEFDNVVIPSQNNGIFYTSEAYVIRWGYQITIVRELEGLGPGQGIFARDRAYQKSLQEAKNGKPPPTKKEKRAPVPGEESESDSDAEEEEDEEQKRVLESGGRDRCAYFFWQGTTCTINEKGASALMTVELDKEKGPQVRVEQGKEPPAFLNLFNGGMMLLKGKSETDSLQSRSKGVRVFSVCGQMKNETCLVEVTPEDRQQPISGCLRSRGCYVIYDAGAGTVFVWYGSKSTKLLKRCATLSARILRNRFPGAELIRANEGQEPNDLCSLLGNKESYFSLMNDTKKYEYTPRLFELSSIIGEFVAEEVPCPWRNDAVNAYPYDQSHLYSVPQPAMFVVDGWTDIYIWLGWWPVERNKLLKEANATTGSSHSRWLRDKKLALETAQHYVKACKRSRTPRTHVVMAGSEHKQFTNLFPSWEEHKSVQELNCKGKPYPKRLDLEDELAKYSRTQFKLEDLKQKPPPEGVDPSRLEIYLSDDDFLKIFKVDKAEFAKMPLWKQTDKKKAVGLF